jgi:uncharacterized membrane protein
MYGNNPRSTAQVAGHPIHPMLVPLPIASFIGALVTDVAGKVTGDPAWSRASRWLLGAGLVTSLGAAAGLVGYSGWLGGELSYRHRVGVQETQDEFSGYDDGHAEGGMGIPRGPALKEEMAEAL